VSLTNKNSSGIIRAYLLRNKLLSLAAMYFLLSIALKMTFSIDVLIPCIWKTFFHVSCPGCGITTSFIEILRMNFQKAFDITPLTFFVIPTAFLIVWFDFLKFKRKLKSDIQNL